ncbi:MAG: hypothetical protein AAFP90_10480, partial [Planctomycetota bacterium]
IETSANMSRWSRRIYNAYFIRLLLTRIPHAVKHSERFRQQNQLPLPRDMQQFDEVFTAPLSGFSSARQYYEFSQSLPHLPNIQTPTWILASTNDPIIPYAFDEPGLLSASTTLWKCDRGGHVGWISASRWLGLRRHWMCDRVENFVDAAPSGTVAGS